MIRHRVDKPAPARWVRLSRAPWVDAVVRLVSKDHAFPAVSREDTWRDCFLDEAVPGPAEGADGTGAHVQAEEATQPGLGAKGQARHWLLPDRPVHPGVTADQAQVGDLAIRAASVIGPGHRGQEPAGPRQDAYLIARDRPSEHVVVAVAGGVAGAGSAEVGSVVAVNTATNLLYEELAAGRAADEIDVRSIFEETAQIIMRAAAEQGLADDDVRCVLAVAVTSAIPPGVDGERTAWVSWVGDVSAWVLSEGLWSLAAGDRTAGRDDAVYNAVRHTLPGRAGEVETRLVRLRAGDVLVLTTDGIGDGLATLPPLREHLAQRWRLPCSMTSFLNDVNYDAERFPEDRTAVALWTSVV